MFCKIGVVGEDSFEGFPVYCVHIALVDRSNACCAGRAGEQGNFTEEVAIPQRIINRFPICCNDLDLAVTDKVEMSADLPSPKDIGARAEDNRTQLEGHVPDKLLTCSL